MSRHLYAPMWRTRSYSPPPNPAPPSGATDHPTVDEDTLPPNAWQWQAYELRVLLHMAATYTTAKRGP
jgi:hypothetical protein